MLTRRSNIPVSFSKTLYIYLALLLLVIPARLLFAAVVSAAVHELFHIAALRLMRIQIISIHIGVRGARIKTVPMSNKQELICSAAGPVGGLLLLSMYRWIPIIALIGAIQSLYNLLPLYPTDGGRVLACSLKLFLPDSIAESVVYATEIITLSTITAIGIYCSVWMRLGILPVLFAVSLILRAAQEK